MTSHEAWARSQAIRFGRVLAAARRHLPKWMLGAIGIALAIPGPQDEIIVALVIAAWAAFKPAMRVDVRRAWESIYV